MAACSLRVSGNSIVFAPAAPAETFQKVYRVNPSVKASLSVTNLARDLAELQYDAANNVTLRYLPELGQLEVRTTRDQYWNLETLLESHDIVVPATARYRLIGRTTAGRHELLLSEITTGRTWRYQAQVGAGSVRVERFSESLNPATMAAGR